MGGPSARRRQFPQSIHRVELLVTASGRTVGTRCEQQVTAFGHQQEDQPVDEAQKLAEKVESGQIAVAEALPQRAVAPVDQESFSQRDDGFLDALA